MDQTAKMDMPRSPSEAWPFIVYTLHIEPPIGQKAHYVGITKRENFRKRMDRHMRGHGARLIARALDAGSSVYIVFTERAASYEAERKAKQRGHFRECCPLCLKPELMHSGIITPMHDLRAPRQPILPITDWPMRHKWPRPP